MQFRDVEATDFDDNHRQIRGSIPDRVCRLMQDYAVTNVFIPLTVFKSCVHLSGSILRANLSLRAIMSAGEQMGEEFNHRGRVVC
jgi:acyl-coenzyme A synthetase/AMP-(fatty) acid ligase